MAESGDRSLAVLQRPDHACRLVLGASPAPDAIFEVMSTRISAIESEGIEIIREGVATAVRLVLLR